MIRFTSTHGFVDPVDGQTGVDLVFLGVWWTGLGHPEALVYELFNSL